MRESLELQPVPENPPATSPVQTVTPNPELRFEMSAGIGHLIEALAKARKAFKPVLKESSNPFFKSKYADLAAVIEATKEGLSANGLAVIQPPTYDRGTGTVQVFTLLAHSSGEWIRTTLDMPVSKPDAQGVGSAITYGRRYSYSGILNVASEEDDDGNAASKRGKPTDIPADAKQMPEERLVECQDWLMGCDSVESLQAAFNKVYKEATTLMDKDAMTTLIAVKDRRKKELSK